MKPILYFDIEATGTDPATDRIVQLAAVKWPKIPRTEDELSTGFESLSVLCNPGRVMSEEVIAIHGITNAVVANRATFRTFCAQVVQFFTGCDLVGFNYLNFDVPLLYEEMARNGFKLDLGDVAIIDASNIFRKMHPRTLEAAVKVYANRDHTGAHDALFDSVATAEVLAGQLRAHSELADLDVKGLAAFSGDARVDLAGKIVRNRLGVPCYTIGQAKGVAVVADPGFGRWMQRQAWVTQETKDTIDRILAEDAQRGGRA